MFKPLFALSLLVTAAASAAKPAALSLEDTFDAHVRVITQNDEDARTALRNSLRTADPAQYPDIGDIVDTLYAFEHLMTGFDGPAAVGIAARRRSIQCSALRVEKNDASDRGTVDYRCRLPDISAAFDAYRESRTRFRREQSADALSAFLETYAITFRDAPDTTFEATAEFSRAGENGPWSSAHMMLLGLELLKVLMPFEQWDEQIEAEAVSAHSGIPACARMHGVHALCLPSIPVRGDSRLLAAG